MVNWLIEKDMFEEHTEDFITACEKYGHKAHLIQYVPFSWEQKIPEYDINLATVFYGSLNLAHMLLNNDDMIGFPGVYYHVNNFKCSTYYAFFGKHHVNKDSYFMPWAEFIRRKDSLPFEPVFIRPDSGSKLFTGTLLRNKDNYDKDIAEITRYSCIEPTDMIVVGKARHIIDEYRFVVIGSEIITGSRYIAEGRLSSYRIDEKHDAWKYAQEVLNDVEWRPDDVFILDVCKTTNGYEVMEIGCFSCCGLYDCDIDIIVKKVSEEAERFSVNLMEEPTKI